MLQSKDLAQRVINEHHNKQFLTESDIYWTLMSLGQKQPAFLKVINSLVEDFNYVKVINNTDEVDEFGDGHIYSPAPNQECNDYEEWAWMPKPEPINVKKLMD